MSLNKTPRSERIQIGIFGKRNAGKSSLINAITGQDLAIVSPVEGTTTDPVSKSMELPPLGPVVLIDTPGLDDEGELGRMRVKKAKQVVNRADLALLAVDSTAGLTRADRELQKLLAEKKIPFITVMTKGDLTDKTGADQTAADAAPDAGETILVSAKTGWNIHQLKELIARLIPREETGRLVGDLVSPHDFVVLVVPIDKAAPKGRLILPQQQVIRDLLEAGAVSVVIREHELVRTLADLGKKPALVITDSQAFKQVAADTPADIPLTSFSILLARSKGNLAAAVSGAAVLDTICDGDNILIAEACTHHRQCDDIGTEKLPRWIREYTGKTPAFTFTCGTEFPDDLSPYRLIIHCGGCMINAREMKYRIAQAENQSVPITNYGILIAHINGILSRSVEPLLFCPIPAPEYNDKGPQPAHLHHWSR